MKLGQKLSKLILLLLLSCSSSTYFISEKTIAVVVKGRKGQTLFLKESVKIKNETVEELSQRILNEKSPNYVSSEGAKELMGLKANKEGNDPENYKAFGWCYFVDGINYNEAPNDLLSDKISHELLWAYSFSEFKDGQWQSSCFQDK